MEVFCFLDTNEQTAYKAIKDKSNLATKVLTLNHLWKSIVKKVYGTSAS